MDQAIYVLDILNRQRAVEPELDSDGLLDRLRGRVTDDLVHRVAGDDPVCDEQDQRHTQHDDRQHQQPRQPSWHLGGSDTLRYYCHSFTFRSSAALSTAWV